MQLFVQLSQLLLLLQKMLTSFMKGGGSPGNLLILCGEVVQEVQRAADLALQPSCDGLLPLQLCLVSQIGLVLLCS